MSFAMRQFLTPRAMLAPIIVMYIKQWDLTDPEVVFNIRCFYACSQSIMFLTMAFIRCAPFSCAARGGRALRRGRPRSVQVAREGNTKVIRVSKPGQPSLLDPTVQPTAKVESMTIQEYEAELVYKEVMQVRTPLPPPTAAARRRCAQGPATAHPCRCPARSSASARRSPWGSSTSTWASCSRWL